MLSQTSEYALRAILHLAARDDPSPSSVEEIARVLDVPRNYLSKILHLLAREGILRSTRGPRGGFELGVPASAMSLDAVVRTFEPQLLSGERRCLLGRRKCSDEDPCQAHDRWKEVSREVRSFFRETTVAELLTRPEAEGALLVPVDDRGREGRGIREPEREEGEP